MLSSGDLLCVFWDKESGMKGKVKNKKRNLLHGDRKETNNSP